MAKANLLALEKGDDEIINISTNRSTTINELVEIMNKFMEEPQKPIYKEPRKQEKAIYYIVILIIKRQRICWDGNQIIH
nr:hypothetical protein [Thermoanaerobacterium sp. CMT5567-10]